MTSKNIVFLGPPGAGKGTQAALLAKNLGIPHISTGAMLRAEVEKGSRLGNQVSTVLAAGALVDDVLMFEIVQACLNAPNCLNGFILDGFPRTAKQAIALDAVTTIHYVVNFDVSEDILTERLLKRQTEQGRSDDTLATLTHRLSVYRAKTQPLVDHYSQADNHMVHIQDTGNESIETLAQKIQNALTTP